MSSLPLSTQSAPCGQEAEKYASQVFQRIACRNFSQRCIENARVSLELRRCHCGDSNASAAIEWQPL
jgi:hypothetical protein